MMKKFFAVLFCLFVFLAGYLTVRAEEFDGTASHWDNPKAINVYIPPHHPYASTIRHAFEYWDQSAGINLHFVMVSTPDQAQDEVIFVEKLDGTAVGLTQKKFQRTTYTDGTEKIKLVGMKIYIAMQDPQGKQMSRDQIYTVALHEVGHSLGLGHTQDPKSIMYPNAYKYGLMEVTRQDMINLYNLYGWRY